MRIHFLFFDQRIKVCYYTSVRGGSHGRLDSVLDRYYSIRLDLGFCPLGSPAGDQKAGKGRLRSKKERR